MNKNLDLFWRAFMSWFLILTATAITMSATGSAFYAILLFWNASGTALQFDNPGRLAAGLGALCAAAVISLMGEAQYRFVFQSEET